MSEKMLQTRSLGTRAGMNRRSFLASTSVAAGTVAFPAILTAKASARAGSHAPIAKTACGRVRGAVKEGVNVFIGVQGRQRPLSGREAGLERPGVKGMRIETPSVSRTGGCSREFGFHMPSSQRAFLD